LINFLRWLDCLKNYSILKLFKLRSFNFFWEISEILIYFYNSAGKNSHEESFNFPNLTDKFAKENSASIMQHHLYMQQNTSASSLSTDAKVRKRSANQAYEYLISLPDSKTFQDWLSTNETDFTWVHKRNSMTNAGKKYYYICNYRIKKGYTRCPAVIYALFPNSNDTTVMVYSCGDHEHSRLNGAPISLSQSESPCSSQTNDWSSLNKLKSMNSFGFSPNQSNLIVSPQQQQNIYNNNNQGLNSKLPKQGSGSINLNNEMVVNLINNLHQQRQRSINING